METRGQIVGSVVFVVALCLALMFGLPPYLVWQQGKSGEAMLKRAEQTRQVLVTQARAEKEASQLRADAIAIVGEAAQKYPEYRAQEFIGAFANALEHGNINQIIYVPTEANLPIIEARPKVP